MQRRLPLAAAPDAVPDGGDPSISRVPLSSAIGIADPTSGLHALEFALALSAALPAPVHVALLDFAAVPSAPRRFAERFTALQVAVSAHAIDASAPTLPAALLDAQAWLLCVGAPAVTAFAPRLSLVVAADTPVTQWPPRLRAARGTFALQLMQLRPGLAEALAAALNPQGFLPRRGHGVRL